MRKIDKDIRHAITTRLRLINYDDEVKLCVQNRKGEYSSSRYGHDDVRYALIDIYKGKCCYCESKVKPISTPQIEHFRPKSKIAEVNDQGYYWLGNEWTNLLLICPSCNQSKGTKFPTRNANVVNHPININGDIDFDHFTYNSVHLSTEEPLLLNPEYDNPLNFLRVNKKGKLKSIGNNYRAKKTIKTIGLNEEDLKIERKKVVDKIVSDLRKQLLQKHRDIEPLSEYQFTQQLYLIFKKMISRKNINKKYTIVGHYMINDFDEMILSQIDEPFRDEIKTIYKSFLNSLFI